MKVGQCDLAIKTKLSGPLYTKKKIAITSFFLEKYFKRLSYNIVCWAWDLSIGPGVMVFKVKNLHYLRILA